MSVSSMSDINSLDEVESELSFDDEAKVSPIPRRLSHRSAALLTAQATTSTPRRVSTPLRAPSMIRSSPSISRSVTAPAPGTAPVESFDRLKHLKIHMKQLQKLYNQEVHLEELAARDAFLQTMCTSSITLFRHCAYRSRFFIAVKALLCQYLPASNAKLIQVERSSSDNKCYLVLQDSQTFEVTAESDSIGIASSAAHAMLMMEGGDPLSPNLSRSSSSNGSSAASEARTSDDVTYGSAWLNSHADCVLPSASGHLLLLFPVHALYRIGFHQETDLAARKRDGEGAQLLVMGMKSASGYPIGIVEAILPSDSQYNVEFLDALGVLLATALESRLTICRSVVDKLEIQVVDSRSQGGQSRSTDSTSDRSPALSVPLLENCGRIDLLGGAAVLPEQDEALLRAFQTPLTRLCSENRDLHQQAHGFERSLVGFSHLWGNVNGDAVEDNRCGSARDKWKPVRAYFSTFMDRLIADYNSRGGAEDRAVSAQIRFVFRGETKDVFKRAYAADNEHIESASSLLRDADGHFSFLQQVMDSSEAFESGETMLVLPIRDEEPQLCKDKPNGAPQSSSRAAAAMVLILPTASGSSSITPTFSKMIKLHVAPLLVQFAEHLLFKMKQRDQVNDLQQRLEAMSEHEAALNVQITDGMILKDITQQFLSCSSLEELVLCANSIASSSEDVQSKFARATLFVASAKETPIRRRKSITSVWSVAEDVETSSCKRLELIDERNPDEMCGCGIPSFVLFTQEPLSYTSSHHAFSPSRQDQHGCFYAVPLNASSGEPLGVLDFAFESESQRERFLGDPLLLNATTEVLSQFIALHQQFNRKGDRSRQEVHELKDLQNRVLEKWAGFVTKWSSLPQNDFEAWKHEVTLLLRTGLLPLDGYFVNLLCSVQNQTGTESAAVRTILSEASHPPHSSNTLNVLNQAILSSCMAFPLTQRSEGLSEDDEVVGVLAFSKKDDESFTSEERQLGAMASCLLSHQVMQFKQNHEFEAVIRDYKERIEGYLDTIARCKASNGDLAKELRLKQSLLQVTSIRFDELLPSRSIEQLCEHVIQSISKSSGAALKSVERSQNEDVGSGTRILVFDANQQSFSLVGSGRPGITISVSYKEAQATADSWFSKHCISTHKAPFTMLPSKLTSALSASQLESVTIVPVCGEDESKERKVFGLIVVGSEKDSEPTTDEYVFGLAECFSRVFRMKLDHDNRNAKQLQLERTISDLHTQKQASGLWSEVYNLSHELSCELLSVLGSHGSLEEWKRRLKSRLAESLIKTLRDHVELTRVELTVGKRQCELDGTTTGSELLLGGDSTFKKEMVVSGEEEVFLGLLCIGWNPNDSKPQQQDLPTLLEWISVYLRNLLHLCLVFETIQSRVKESETECLALKHQVSEVTEVINRMGEENLQWFAIHSVTQACRSIVESGKEPDAEMRDGDSRWSHLFATIHSIEGVGLKLWLVDETSTTLWTLLDGKKETKPFPLRKDKATSESRSSSFIELACEQDVSGSNTASRIVLGVLEAERADQPTITEKRSHEDGAAIQQLVIVLTQSLRLVRQANLIHKLGDSIQQLELKSVARSSAWKHDLSACFKQMLKLQTKVNKFVSDKSSTESPVGDPEDSIRKLLAVVETSAQSSWKEKSSSEAVSCGSRMLHLRSFLLFEGEEGKHESSVPRLVHSCEKDCSVCVKAAIVANIHEVDAAIEENGDGDGFVLGVRLSASEEARSRGSMKHPALSLLLPSCHVERQRENRWEPDVLLEKSTASTHQLVVKTFHRTISGVGELRVVLVGVVERSAEIGDISSSPMLSFYGEAALDGVQRLLRTAALQAQSNVVGADLLKAEQLLVESGNKGEIFESALTGVGSMCLATIDLANLASSLSVLLDKVFQTLTGTTVSVHVCARVSSSESPAQWEVIGGEHDSQATQELLLQIIKSGGETASAQGRMVNRSDGGGSLIYQLLDARGTVIGALVLDGSPGCLAQLQINLAGPVKAVLQVVAAAVANLQIKLQRDTQTQTLLEERDQLLADKCQLELNSLEMKSLLHTNEAHLLDMRSHYEQVVLPTNSAVRVFLYELKVLKTPRDVILGLGQAITSLKDVTGVQLTAVRKSTESDDPPTVFSSIVREEDKRVLRSQGLQDAIQRCVKQSEMIQVHINKQGEGSRCTERPESCTQSSKGAVMYPMTVAEVDQGGVKLSTPDAVAEPCQTKDLVVVVLTNASSLKPPKLFDAVEESNSMVYQLEQVKLLIHLATMRCHSLAQRDLWKQQLGLCTEKERNAEDQIDLLNLKCGHWQNRRDLQAQLQCGLVHQLALGLPSLYTGGLKALSSKQMLSMWQALLEILCSRLEGAFRKRTTITRSSVQLYGTVQEGNVFFTFGKSSGAKRLQLISSQQCAKDPSYQMIWKALVNEAVVEGSLGDHKVSSSDATAVMQTAFPIMGITGDEDQGHERVVGVLEFQCEQLLDDGEKAVAQEFLTWFSPALVCVGRSVYRKILKKHESRQTRASRSSDPHRQSIKMAYALSHKTSSRSLDLASPAQCSDRQKHMAGDAFSHDHDDGRTRASMEADNTSTVESAEGEEADDSDGEAMALRKTRDKLLPGVLSLLLKLQGASDVRSLMKVVQSEIKRLWPFDSKKPRQSIHECQLLCCEDLEQDANHSASKSNNADPEVPPWVSELMRSERKAANAPEFQVLRGIVPTSQYESSEQFWLILLPPINRRSTLSCLVTTGSSLDALFTADDERVHLPQIARCVHRQLSQLTRLTELQEVASQLQETKSQESGVIAKANQLERTVAGMSGFLVFQSALSGVESERALSSVTTEYLKKLLQCERIVFQVSHSGSRARVEPSHQLESDDDTVALATSTLEMDNILRLRVFSPHSNGTELLAMCTARMGANASLLDAHKQELLRRVSPLIGSTMDRIRIQEKLSQQVRVSDNALNDLERLSRENKELQDQLQQQSHSREDFDTRLGDQQALIAENKCLEVQCARLVSQLDAFAREREEQQFELAAREKVNAKLTFQLDQFAKVETQLQGLDDENSALRHREKKLEKKILKQRLQLQQLVSEVGRFKQKEEFDRHEIAQLQRQVAVLNEKQRHSGGSAKEPSLRSQSTSRYFQHMQHQVQKRKQESLAQELRQLTAMEIREMKIRNREQRGNRSRQAVITQSQDGGPLDTKPPQAKSHIA